MEETERICNYFQLQCGAPSKRHFVKARAGHHDFNIFIILFFYFLRARDRTSSRWVGAQKSLILRLKQFTKCKLYKRLLLLFRGFFFLFVNLFLFKGDNVSLKHETRNLANLKRLFPEVRANFCRYFLFLKQIQTYRETRYAKSEVRLVTENKK